MRVSLRSGSHRKARARARARKDERVITHTVGVSARPLGILRARLPGAARRGTGSDAHRAAEGGARRQVIWRVRRCGSDAAVLPGAGAREAIDPAEHLVVPTLGVLRLEDPVVLVGE